MTKYFDTKMKWTRTTKHGVTAHKSDSEHAHYLIEKTPDNGWLLFKGAPVYRPLHRVTFKTVKDAQQAAERDRYLDNTETERPS